MDIAIIGAGAMGSLFGYYLAEGGFKVSLVDPWDEHIRAVNDAGLTVLTENGALKPVFPRGFLFPDRGKVYDLLIFFVKSYHTARAAADAKALAGPDTVVLTLQNGLGNVEIIREALGRKSVLVGTTAHGATVLGPGKIRHAGKGETVIGTAGGGGGQSANLIAGVFNRCGLEARVSSDIDSVIWGKLLINAAINPVTALLHVPNGELFRREHSSQLVELLVSEVAQVAAGKGIRLPYTDPLEKVRSVSEQTAINRSSMLQDMEKGRPTEIDFINGAVLREGKELGIHLPCNTVITLLIKALEG